jgi:hypothetical protein
MSEVTVKMSLSLSLSLSLNSTLNIVQKLYMRVLRDCGERVLVVLGAGKLEERAI